MANSIKKRKEKKKYNDMQLKIHEIGKLKEGKLYRCKPSFTHREKEKKNSIKY